MKTPIQQLIEKWEQEKGSYIPNSPIFQEFINDAKKMLEKEKEVIVDAYRKGFWEAFAEHNGEQPYRFAEEYYNETFNTEER